MRRMLECLRFFVISFESIIVGTGALLRVFFLDEVQRLLSPVKIETEPLKFLVAIPAALCVWSFVSGRKLLFPDKDKHSILQAWPDYWKLKSGFSAALTWNVIFAALSVIAWVQDWKPPKGTSWIYLAVSLAGASVSSLSIYNAQCIVEEQTSQYKRQQSP
jgi:hypothetical protein